jgi:phosphatidylinositol-3,4,5-trisphosphate 3-phosphatase/dual-specificity protein phosphatase PTEN
MGCCCSCTRQCVSKKKIRTKLSEKHSPIGGIDLDLTRVHKNIVCMGVPASGIQSWYRNPSDNVVLYLDFAFGDNYQVYNLCDEPCYQYDPKNFHGRVVCFPFPDGHACPLEYIPAFVAHAMDYIDGRDDRVVVIHCKAGKGRTGLMTSCLLMALEPGLRRADDAIEYYGKRRTLDGKGLTVRSQIRYVHYYERLRCDFSGLMPRKVPSISIHAMIVNAAMADALPDLKEMTVRWTGSPALRIPLKRKDAENVRRDESGVFVDLRAVDALNGVHGDVRIEFLEGGGSLVGSLMFHTLFTENFYLCTEMDKLCKRVRSEQAGLSLEFFEALYPGGTGGTYTSLSFIRPCFPIDFFHEKENDGLLLAHQRTYRRSRRRDHGDQIHCPKVLEVQESHRPAGKEARWKQDSSHARGLPGLRQKTIWVGQRRADGYLPASL